MGHFTHKRKNNRRGVTRRVQGGGLFGKNFSQRETDGLYEQNMIKQLTKDDKIYDKHIGVLLSVNSLNSSDLKIRGTPYVVIVPYRENGIDTPKYAYGSTADNAVKNAMNKIFDKTDRHKGDTYTGTAISYRSLFSTDPKLKNEPYVINIDGKDYYGTTPTNAVKKIAGGVFQRATSGAYSAVKSAFRRTPKSVAPAPAPASAAAAAPAAAPAPAVAPAPAPAPAPPKEYEWPDGSIRPTPPP